MPQDRSGRSKVNHERKPSGSSRITEGPGRLDCSLNPGEVMAFDRNEIQRKKLHRGQDGPALDGEV